MAKQHMEITICYTVSRGFLFVEVLRLFRKYNVQYVEVFAKNATKTALDQMHSALVSGLPQVGYTT